MDILDIFAAETPDETYRVMGMEYSRETHPCRCTSFGETLGSVAEAEDLALEHFTVLSEFSKPKTELVVTGNLGHLAYKNRWSIVVIYREQTGIVASQADVPG